VCAPPRLQVSTLGEKHAEFASLYKDLLRGLLAYVKEHHASGVHWNPAGEGAAS